MFSSLISISCICLQCHWRLSLSGRGLRGSIGPWLLPHLWPAGRVGLGWSFFLGRRREYPCGCVISVGFRGRDLQDRVSAAGHAVVSPRPQFRPAAGRMLVGFVSRGPPACCRSQFLSFRLDVASWWCWCLVTYSEDAQPKTAAFTRPFPSASFLTPPPLAHPVVVVLTAPAQTRLVFEVPSRGLMGFGAEIRQETHGSAVVNSTFV